MKKENEHEYDTDNPSNPIIDRSSVKEENDEGGCFGKGPGKANHISLCKDCEKKLILFKLSI